MLPTFKQFLVEGVIRPNVYFRVLKPMEVFHGVSSGTAMGPTYHSVELEEGDEIHWLEGGMYAVIGGSKRLSINIVNPDDFGEGDYHAYRQNPDSFTSNLLMKLKQAQYLEEI